MTTDRKVQGCCPMGCGETLFLGNGGYVTCALIDCPAPTVADQILHTRETEHVVEFNANGFTIQHPLRERIDCAGDLFNCDLHEYCSGLDGPPVVYGRYRVTRKAGNKGWAFLPVSDRTAA